MTESTYGFTFAEVSAVHRPRSVAAMWGDWTVCAAHSDYQLARLRLASGSALPMRFYPAGSGVYWIEDGDVVFRARLADGREYAVEAKARSVLEFGPGMVHGFATTRGAVVFQCSTPDANGAIDVETAADAARLDWKAKADALMDYPVGTSHDIRQKYWGQIETIVSREFAAKRIQINRGGQSSLEYHVQKSESYFVHSGSVRVGLRVGRARNHSIVLEAGDVFHVPAGLMHMRMGLEDAVIIEVSTRDTDKDSHLVEDGRTYKHEDSGDEL